ncbi:hypothetical protein ND991_21875 [Gordonia sputi]|uniref:hypothetical protein n=1 Tax=Gordonia sputi TaxID=36823 RepID=UPI00204456F9|nr:hypothetical protein [Gordonia sputi]MCM3897854.1 hypothetical protein [Gordonia sputi]
MPHAPTLPAFTPDEQSRVHSGLALQVARMMGRKLEEDDWSAVYCAAKGIENTGWSNLDIDVMNGPLGIEHKMLCYRSKPDLEQACGTSLMHPALTRSIRIPSVDMPADEVMADVFDQYRLLLEERKLSVMSKYDGSQPIELRTGWLLWQESLRQFMYFEELTMAPNPEEHVAHWNERGAGGRRKPSKNLWIYEKESGRKRYSVTTSAGIKIQPYFDVPLPDDPNLYTFTVIGERIDAGHVRAAVTQKTYNALAQLTDVDSPRVLSKLILETVSGLDGSEDLLSIASIDEVRFLTLTEDAYLALGEAFGGVNDDHNFQLLIDILSVL